jgi:hypothetical protein
VRKEGSKKKICGEKGRRKGVGGGGGWWGRECGGLMVEPLRVPPYSLAAFF